MNNQQPYTKQKQTQAIPHDTLLEQGVLGALLLEQETLTQVIDLLKPAHFYQEKHRDIYTAITTLFKLGESIDILTIVNRLRKDGTLKQVGGAGYLTQLTENITSSAHIESHARLIIEYAIRRELIKTATHIKDEARDDTKEVFSLLDLSQQKLFAIAERNAKKNYVSISVLMKHAITDLEANKLQNNEITGIPSGFKDLDRLTLGWQKSDLIVIAGRPGMGKTSFALSILANATITHKTPAILFSIEMSEEQITKRLIAMESGLSNQKLKQKQLKPYEWTQLYSKTANLIKAPIWVDTMHTASVFELRAKARRLKAQHDIGIIVIDYLQLMKLSDSNKNNRNRQEEIASISNFLKALAKELNIPVIALSQLSRAPEIRGGDKRPQIADLRESGAIEQDADLVILTYRPSYYGITESPDGTPFGEGFTELIIAKHRNGPLGTIPLTYLPSITKFIPYEQPSAYKNTYIAF